MIKRDVLVLFAADQLGVKIQQVEEVIGGGLTWVQVDDHGTPVDDYDPFTWEWMGRGMEVCSYLSKICKDQFGSNPECFTVHVGDRVASCAQVDVPLTFWSLWQQLGEG